LERGSLVEIGGVAEHSTEAPMKTVRG